MDVAKLKKKVSGNRITSLVVYLLAVGVIYPFLLLFITTFKDEDHIYNPFSMPDFTFIDNYVKVFEQSKFFTALGITILICVSTLVLVILFASMAGYMISRSKEGIFRYSYLVIVAGLIVPAQTNMVVIYKMGNTFHMINTVPFLILMYVAGASAFASLIYVAITKSIPKEIEESSKLDGCGQYMTFFRIVFPLLKPATGTVIATTIFWFWNDFQGPLIYLNNGKTPTLMYLIYSFKTNVAGSGIYLTAWGPVFALCFLASLPILIFFLFTQKYLIKGVTAGAVKG